MSDWYVYVIYEFPAVEPYYVKVGITSDTRRRLSALQAGNPRFLRATDLEQKPDQPFGVRVNSRKIAEEVEAEVHRQLITIGIGLNGDFDYQSQMAFPREWFVGLHPDQVWLVVLKAASPYLYQRE